MYATPLKRPDERLLRKFHLGMIGQDTVGEYLGKGLSLGICCIMCPHMAEWTPPEIERRFGDKPELLIRDIAERLKCPEADCGSKKIAVWARPYELPWTWTPRAS